jgi:hypothetical protein
MVADVRHLLPAIVSVTDQYTLPAGFLLCCPILRSILFVYEHQYHEARPPSFCNWPCVSDTILHVYKSGLVTVAAIQVFMTEGSEPRNPTIKFSKQGRKSFCQITKEVDGRSSGSSRVEGVPHFCSPMCLSSVGLPLRR